MKTMMVTGRIGCMMGANCSGLLWSAQSKIHLANIFIKDPCNDIVQAAKKLAQ